MGALTIIALCLLGGILIGFILRRQTRMIRCADRIALYAIYGLLFVLGAGLGVDDSLFARLFTLGVTALCITICCSLGTIIALYFLRPFFPASLQKTQSAAAERPMLISPFWGTLRILSCFIAGIVLGRLSLLPLWLCQKELAEYALWVLVASVGVSLGSELKAFGVLRDMRFKVLLVPLCIMAGTAFGSVVAAAILPDVGVRDALCVGAGYGYYSLSSVIIGQSGNTILASIALLSNIFRELLGVLCAPLLVRFGGPLALIGVAGATAMDTCLPLVARFSGERFAIIAVFSGMALSMAVPFMVSAILQW